MHFAKETGFFLIQPIVMILGRRRVPAMFVMGQEEVFSMLNLKIYLFADIVKKLVGERMIAVIFLAMYVKFVLAKAATAGAAV